MSNIAKKIIDEFNDEEKEQIKSWAEDAYVIRNDPNLTRKEKITNLGRITNKNKVIIKFLTAFFKFVKRHAWDERGWAGRLTLGSLALGTSIAGTKMAGIATAGMGIGLPIWLLSSAGGALLGAIIQELADYKTK